MKAHPASDAGLGLRLVGPATPVDAAKLDEAAARDGVRFPPSYRRLLETWGVGQLCGFAYLLDPTDPSVHAAWRAQREFMTGAGLELRRDSGEWAAIDADTWRRLVVWADLDAKLFAWDTGSPDARGEFPVWFLSREGFAMRAASSLEELVSSFLLGGGLDRVHPPAEAGRWECTETYVTARERDLPTSLVATLRRGALAETEALLAAHRDSVNGYEAGAQLLAALLSVEADDLAAPLRLEWLERACAWVDRCAPHATRHDGVPHLLEALRRGQTIDGLVTVSSTVARGCAPLTVSGRIARWNAFSVILVVENPGETPSAPCTLTVDGSGAAALEWAIPPLAPGSAFPISFGVSSLPLALRAVLA